MENWNEALGGIAYASGTQREPATHRASVCDVYLTLKDVGRNLLLRCLGVSRDWCPVLHALPWPRISGMVLPVAVRDGALASMNQGKLLQRCWQPDTSRLSLNLKLVSTQLLASNSWQVHGCVEESDLRTLLIQYL